MKVIWAIFELRHSLCGQTLPPIRYEILSTKFDPSTTLRTGILNDIEYQNSSISSAICNTFPRIKVLLSPLRGSGECGTIFFRGLAPTAKYWRPFGAKPD